MICVLDLYLKYCIKMNIDRWNEDVFIFYKYLIEDSNATIVVYENSELIYNFNLKPFSLFPFSLSI